MLLESVAGSRTKILAALVICPTIYAQSIVGIPSNSGGAGAGGSATPTGPAGGVLAGTYPNPSFASTTGTGATVQATSPTLVTPALGIPTALVLTNATGLPNAGLVNPATTVNGQTCTLGSACTIPADFSALTSGTNTTAVMIVGTGGSLAVPTQSQNDNSTKAASTAYTDLAVANAVAGVNPAVAVQVGTTTVLPNSPTYSNGASGIGATLTAGSAATLVIDGYTPVLSDRILVKNQASAFQNGVYSLSTLGTGIVPYILTRALDFDQPSDINNTGAIPIVNGTVNTVTQWVVTSKVTTVGTDSVTFTKFSSNPATSGGVTPTSGTFAALPSCTSSVLMYLFSDSFYNFARCDAASAWHYFLGGKEMIPMVTGNFSWQNQGTSTDTTTFGGNILAYANTGSTGTAAVRGFFESYPGGTFTITTAMTWGGAIATNNNGGLGISDGTQYEWFRLTPQGTAGAQLAIGLLFCTTSTCGSSSIPYAGPTIPCCSNAPFWERMQDDGTNRIWSWSIDGTTWIPAFTESRTANLTPTKIGIVGNGQSTFDVVLTVTNFVQGS